MADTTTNKPGDQMILRCPFCKARAESEHSECAICGETLTPQNVLRVKASVKIFSRPLLPQADTTASPPTPAAPKPEPTAIVTPAPPAPPIHTTHTPRTEPLKPPRPLTQSNPRVNIKNSRQPSGYTVGLLVGFAVIVLGAAILIGVNLAHQATTEAKATEQQAHAQALKITVMYKEAEPTRAPVAPTVTLPATAVLSPTDDVKAIATSASTSTVAPTLVAPTATPIPPTATAQIIPIFSPTPTRQPTLVPTATRLPASATPTLAPTQTQVPSATATYTPAPTQTATQTALPTATSTAPPTAAPTLMGVPTAAAKWNLTLAAARYEASGWPMQACSNFNANVVMRKFTFTLHITQSTGRDLAANEWGVAAFVGNTRVQQVCYFKTEGPTPPALPNGAERQVTLSAFVAQGESVTALVVGDTTGSAERICVKDTRVDECK